MKSYTLRGASACVAVLAAFAMPHPASAAIGLGPKWADWKASSPLTLSPVHRNSTQKVHLKLPQFVDPGDAGTYEDLRIVDGNGNETPYAIDPGAANEPVTHRALALSDQGFVRGSYSQAIADAGSDGTLIDAVTISTARATFFVRATVEASDDRHTWREIDGDATLYRIAQNGDNGSQTVTFQPTRSRWLRIRVYDAHEAFAVDSINVATASAAPPPLESLHAVIKNDKNPPSGNERFVLDLATPHVAVSALRIDGLTGYFSRDVSVETSDDDSNWNSAGSGRIERFAEGGSHLGFAFDEAHGRYVRVTIVDGNDAPLTGARPVLLAKPRALVFEAAPDATYTLIFNDPNASSPVYDLGDRLARENWHASVDAHAAVLAIDTSLPPDTRGIFQRYPWLVTVAFVIVGLGLALFALQTVRGASKETP